MSDLTVSITLDANGKPAKAEIVGVKDGLQDLRQEQDKSGKAAKRLGKNTADANKSLKDSLSISKLLGPALAALSFGAVAAGMWDTIYASEQMTGSLLTVTGSITTATDAWQALDVFASTTPFTLDQSVNAFIKMRSLGLRPTESALTSFGNTSAAMGKSMTDMIEAVADASTGEFERLKEFGIKASQQGDQVAFTFQNVTTTVGKNSQEIVKYLEDIGNTNFAGAMENQMERLPGIVSNIQDNIDGIFRDLGDAGVTEWLGAQLTAVRNFTGDVRAMIQTGLVFDQIELYLRPWVEGFATTRDAIVGIVEDMWQQITGETTDQSLAAFGSKFDIFQNVAGEVFLNLPDYARTGMIMLLNEITKLVISAGEQWDLMGNAAAVAWENIGHTFASMWLGMRTLAAEAIDWIIERFADMIDRLAPTGAAIDLVPGIDGVENALTGAANALRSYGGNAAEVAIEIAKAETAHQGEIAALEKSAAQISSTAEQRRRIYDTSSQQAQQRLNDLVAERQAESDLNVAFHETDLQMRKYGASLDDVAGETAKLTGQTGDSAKALTKFDRDLNKLIKTLDPFEAEADALFDALDLLEQAQEDGAISAADFDYYWNQAISTMGGAEVAVEQVGKAVKKTSNEIDPFSKALTGMVERIDESFADAWKGAYDSFDEFADRLKGSFKDLLAELAHQAITRPILVNIVAAATGGNAEQAGGLFGDSGSLSYDSLLGDATSYATGYAANYAASLAGGAGSQQAAMLAAQTAEFGVSGAGLTYDSLGYLNGSTAGSTATSGLGAAAGGALTAFSLGSSVSAEHGVGWGTAAGFAGGAASTALAGGVGAAAAGGSFIGGAGAALAAMGPVGWIALGVAALFGAVLGNKKPSDKTQWGNYDLGELAASDVDGFAGKKYSEAMATLRDQTIEAIDTAARELTAATGDSFDGIIRVVAGERDGFRLTFGDAVDEMYGNLDVAATRSFEDGAAAMEAAYAYLIDRWQESTQLSADNVAKLLSGTTTGSEELGRVLEYGQVKQLVETLSTVAEEQITAIDVVAEFNAAVGRTGDAYIDTREELISYANALDLFTQAGREAAVQAVAMADAIDEFEASARAAESAARSASITAINDRITSLSAERDALVANVELTRNNLIASINQEVSAKQSEIAAQQAVANNAIRLADSWTSVSSRLSASAGDLLVLDGPAAVGNAQAAFDQSLRAVFGGDLSAAQALPGLAKSLQSASKQTATSSFDYRFQSAQIAAQLESAAGIAQSRASHAERTANAAEREIEILNSQVEMHLAELAELEETNKEIRSLAEAQADYDAAQRELLASNHAELIAQSEREIAAIEALESATRAAAESTEVVPANLQQFRHGGISTGPDSGYPVELHGTEAVIPINGQALPLIIDQSELISELKGLRSDLRAANGEHIKASQKTAKLMKKWDVVGQPEVRTA